MKAVEVELTQGTVRRHASSVSRSAMPIRKREKRAPGEAEKRRKEKMLKREKLGPGATLQSDNFKWTVLKLLGSGGFGDVYKVVKEENQDRKEYAMKTEMVEGDKRNLRLKIEVHVLTLCLNIEDPRRKEHFLEIIDRGKKEKFKFLVMTLVGPTIEDVRRNILGRNYSRSTAMQIAIQTLQSLADLHDIGYLHRDIKPQNFAIGLKEMEKTIFILDFGIARKYTVGDTKAVKAPRLRVKFIGTIRFASRACHNCIEQGRKDDLESWLYMIFDLMDCENGVPWKRLPDRSQVVLLKEKFFQDKIPTCYRIVPKQFKRLVQYVNCMIFAEQPDYIYMLHSIRSIAKENSIDIDKRLDWVGRLDQDKGSNDDDDLSTDNINTGSDTESGGKTRTRKPGRHRHSSTSNTTRSMNACTRTTPSSGR